MKTKYFILAAMTSIALASCSSDEYVGDTSPTNTSQEAAYDGSIRFGFDVPNITRADLVGASAAGKLQNQFIVYGTKHASAEAGTADNDETVFQNYVVEYTANTAGTTESNTHNWEYVGKTAYAAEKVSPAITGSQAIKYWDYSAAQGYTFYGIASKEDIGTNAKVTVTKTLTGTSVYDKGYSVVLKSGADLDKLFVADRLPVAKTDYGKAVTLKFRNFGARVRVGFYETIPGYTVTIKKFYVDDDATSPTTFSAMENENTTKFAASLQNIKKDAESNTIAVTYYNGTDGPENQVKLAASTADYNYSLVLGSGVLGSAIATSSATPTWDQTSGAYTTVYPLEANSNPMLVKVDYTLTAEDGSNETIEVKGATAVVPTQYVKWKSNFAYTYIFKIAPNSNGYTGETTDLAGLYPITFDAVVVDIADDKTQETITNFEDYSITTYVNGSAVTTDNEYKKNKDIYVVKTDNENNGAVVAPSAIGDAAGAAQVYTATTSSGNPINEATVKAQLNGSPLGITLTAVSPAATLQQKAPAADETEFDFGSNGAVKFTPGAAGTYVYVFTRIVNVAATYTSASSATYDSSTTYYFKNTVSGTDVYYPAAGINEANFDTNKADLYTQNTAGTPGVYDVKVIKVVD
ncbi:MAG: hypothetical protein IJ155_08940 [Prevotella sp.]|nr:hypothetical protein [Prevotella sp.]